MMGNEAIPRVYLPRGGKLSTFMAAVNMMKGLFGLGFIALPYATMQVGWFTSLLGSATVCFMSAYGVFIGIYTLQGMEPVSEKKSLVTQGYGNDADNLGLGPYDAVVARVYGTPGQILCAICIFLGQYATGVAYVDVIAANMDFFFPGEEARVVVLLVLGASLSALSCLKTLGGIAVLSMLALLTYLFIYAGLLGESFGGLVEGDLASSAVMIKRAGANYGTWFGINQFAFGPFPIAMVVYEDMAEPQHIIKVTSWVFVLCWAICMLFAVIGYLSYGDSTQDVIYLNFESAFFRLGSIIAINAILVLSYVLQVFPCYTCVEQLLRTQTIFNQMHYTIVRALVVASTIVVAYVVPSMAVVLDVLGGVAGALTSFVLPALVYMSAGMQLRTWERALCWFMVLFGAVGGVRSTMMN